jgi:hypothetical protein
MAFGTLPLWTSTKVNDGSFCRAAAEPECPLFCRYRGKTGRSADIAKTTQMTQLRHWASFRLWAGCDPYNG